MNLNKRHMVISLILLVGSVIYNVWVFAGSRQTSVTPQPVGSIQPPASDQPTSGNGGPIDPARVKSLSDVALDRYPEWPRNPFENLQPPAEVVEVVEETPPPAPVPEADPVVGTILYSPDRKAAVVDGHIVRIGDLIGTSRVVDILPRAVIVESPERGRRTLVLKPANGAASQK